MEEKTNIPGLYKDRISGAIINKDDSSLIAYKKRKEMFRKIDSLESRIKHLEFMIEKLIGETNK
jgi:hypothetical protein